MTKIPSPSTPTLLALGRDSLLAEEKTTKNHNIWNIDKTTICENIFSR